MTKLGPANVTRKPICSVFAVKLDGSGERMEPQPDDLARDSSGCFRGCKWHGCEATLCAQFKSDAKRGDFQWVLSRP